jgi:hypothetical protein
LRDRELKAVQARGMVYQNLLADGSIRLPHREFVKQKAIVDLEQQRLAAFSHEGQTE